MGYGLTGEIPTRIAVLRLLDNGPAEASVGVEISNLNKHEIRAADHLVERGLVRKDTGWRRTSWYRLTENGRRMVRMVLKK